MRFLLLVFVLLLPSGMMAQSPAAIPGRLLLVLPFDNLTDQPNLDWIGDAVPEVLNRRLASAGFMPISRDDRLYALDHLGLPSTFQPSRASAIRLAQTLDADYVIVGSFSVSGSRFQAKARILKMDALHMSAPLQEEADMTHLLDVLNSLAWGLAKQIDPQFAVARSTFVAAGAGLRVDAFENYTRGLVETDPAEQIRHLKQAVRLDPGFSPALLALGKAYFADQQFELAANTLGRLPRNDPSALEADFDRGLAYFYLGSYVKAEDAFAFVSKQLPLPEVVNNQGVTASRRGQDASSFFQQAVAADGNDPDYQFNLALALNRKKDVAGAMRAIGQTLKLRPQDTEAQAFQATLQGEPARPPAAAAPASSRVNAAFDPTAAAETGPLERIKRTFNEASFRQAAFEMEQMQEERMTNLPPQNRAAGLTAAGMRFFNQGLMLEAEREFQSALQAQSDDADAHAGLALVREHEGDTKEARREATESLKTQPNVTAYLVLGRLDLQTNQKPAAAADVSSALKLEPQNSAARFLKQQVESKGQPVP
ncbi:MAG TPA: tetratricopeptide repeat protein [Acidobacteriaceae bacterium]|nr:tetratricopeptide repeat protein [Acidobacteriaceae bacterium]